MGIMDAFDDLGCTEPDPLPRAVAPVRTYDDVCIDPIFDMSVRAQEHIRRAFPDDGSIFEWDDEDPLVP